jgi:hypothetical protein
MQLDSQQDTIRAVNRTIRDFADDPRIPATESWEFFCECGCFTLVSLTVAEFLHGGPPPTISTESGHFPA